MNRDMEHDGNEHSYLKGKKMKTENTGFINYIKRIEPSSLESSAAMSIAITLWTQTDMKNVLEQQSSTAILKFTKRALEKIKNTGPIPKIIQNFLFSTIRSVGLQLSKCYDSSIEGFLIPCDIFTKGGPVYWTNGVVDEVKSFNALINEPNLDMTKRQLFMLACKYCLEGIIADLWPEVRHGYLNHINSNSGSHLIFYWIAVLQDNLTSFVEQLRDETFDFFPVTHSVYRYMTSNAVLVENIYSLKYFWTKLSEEEKNSNIKTWLDIAIRNCYRTFVGDNKDYEYMQYYECTEILCFLLSHLNDPNKQKEFFHTQSETILKSLFITWPFQEYFLPTLVVMFDYLHHDVYVKIMTDILEAMKEDTTLELLFANIWKISPPLYKKTFYQLIKKSSWVILRMLAGCSGETVRLILGNFPAKEKTQIIFNIFDANHKSEFCDMIYANKLNLLDEIVFKTISSDDDVKTFKKDMIKYAGVLFDKMKSSQDFQAVETFLKWGFHSEDEIQSFKNEINVAEMYKSLMYLGDDELVNQFMNWYFKTEDEMNKFKKNFIAGNERYQCLENEWDLFERYTNNCLKLFSPEEISIFKSDVLIKVSNLLECSKFEFATKLVNWCIDSVDEINLYKRKLLLSPKGISLLNRHFYCVLDEANVEKAIEWFAPISSDTIAELKSLINDDNLFLDLGGTKSLAQMRRAFFYLLDTFVAKSRTPHCGNVLNAFIMSDILRDDEK